MPSASPGPDDLPTVSFFALLADIGGDSIVGIKPIAR
jgi:hypothetical protein